MPQGMSGLHGRAHRTWDTHQHLLHQPALCTGATGLLFTHRVHPIYKNKEPACDPAQEGILVGELPSSQARPRFSAKVAKACCPRSSPLYCHLTVHCEGSRAVGCILPRAPAPPSCGASGKSVSRASSAGPHTPAQWGGGVPSTYLGYQRGGPRQRVWASIQTATRLYCSQLKLNTESKRGRREDRVQTHGGRSGPGGLAGLTSSGT